MNANRLNIFDIVKVSKVSGVFVVIAVHAETQAAKLIDHKGGIHTMRRADIFKTGHSVFSLLDKLGYGHGLPRQDVPKIAAPKAITEEIPTFEPGSRESMEYGPVTIEDPEVDEMIRQMEHKNTLDALLNELSERKRNGAPKRKIHRTIRKLEKLSGTTVETK